MTTDLLRASARERPHACALDGGAREWSYAELDGEVEEVARRLLSARIPRGAVVATVLPVGASAVVLVHALARAGLVHAPLNPNRAQRELVEQLDLLRPSAVVCEAATEALASVVVQGAPLLTLDPSRGTRALELARLPASPEEPAPLDKGAVATILSTSGTSGRPRAALLTAANLATHADAAIRHLELSASDLWLAPLHVSHVGGLATILRTARLGATLVVRGAFDAGAVAALLDAERFTHAPLVPTMLHQIIDARGERRAPGTLRLALIGGAECPRPLLDRALALGYPIALTYGLTEASSQVATATPDLVRKKPGTVGEPLPGVEVQLAPDGEVLVRGPTVFAGYVGETAPEEWHATGDLGRIDEDGHLWIVGRKSDRIITGGTNVEPAEVERVLLEHPGVREAAVVGLPDPQWGERVVAAIVGDVDARMLDAFCRARLSSAKRPRAYVLVEDLPRNANGKVDRGALRALFSQDA